MLGMGFIMKRTNGVVELRVFKAEQGSQVIKQTITIK